MFQRAAIAQLLIHRGSEEAYRAAAFMFCAIERRIGIGEQRPRIGAIARIDRNPDAEIEFEGVPVDLDVLVERARSRSASSSALDGNGSCSVTAMNSSPPTRAR